MHQRDHQTGATIGGIVLIALLLAGCATQRVDWDGRIGRYTYDQAVMELGPPDKEATLSDSTRVCEWLTRRGTGNGQTGYYTGFGYGVYGPYRWYAPGYYAYLDPPSPDHWLRLVFDSEGRLSTWKKLSR